MYAVFASTPGKCRDNGGEISGRTVMVEGVKMQISEIVQIISEIFLSKSL
jgi:hypothetical protein